LIKNLKKYEFGKESLIYLRYMIGGGDLSMDPDKIVEINQWPISTSLTKVRSFIRVD
jgi:hypothetical protein